MSLPIFYTRLKENFCFYSNNTYSLLTCILLFDIIITHLSTIMFSFMTTTKEPKQTSFCFTSSVLNRLIWYTMYIFAFFFFFKPCQSLWNLNAVSTLNLGVICLKLYIWGHGLIDFWMPNVIWSSVLIHSAYSSSNLY